MGIETNQILTKSRGSGDDDDDEDDEDDNDDDDDDDDNLVVRLFLCAQEHDGRQGHGGAGAGVGGEGGAEDKISGGENSAHTDQRHVSR